MRIIVVLLILITSISKGQNTLKKHSIEFYYGTTYFPDSYFKYDLSSTTIGFGRLSYVDALIGYNMSKTKLFNPASLLGFQKGEYIQSKPSGANCSYGNGGPSVQLYNRFRFLIENKFKLISKDKFSFIIFSNVQLVFANHFGSIPIEKDIEKNCSYYNSNKFFINLGLGFESSFSLSEKMKLEIRNSFEYLFERKVLNSSIHLGIKYLLI